MRAVCVVLKITTYIPRSDELQKCTTADISLSLSSDTGAARTAGDFLLVTSHKFGTGIKKIRHALYIVCQHTKTIRNFQLMSQKQDTEMVQ
jgi:hypothetical protein